MSSLKKLWTHLGSNRLLFLSTLAVGLLYCLNSVILPNASGVLVNQVAAAAPLSLGLFLPFLSVSLLQIALSILDDYMSKRLTRKHKQLLRKRAFEGFSLAERYGREDAASFVSFINNDIPSLVEQYFAGMIDIAKCVSLILFSAVSLLSIHWLLAAVILGFSLLIVVIPIILRKISGNARQAYSSQMARYNTALQSFLGGLHILKTYRFRDGAAAQLDAENQSAAGAERILFKWSLTIYIASACLQILKNVLIVGVGVLLVHDGAILTGDLIAVLQLAAVIAAPIEVLAYLLHGRNAAIPLLKQLEDFTSPRAEPLKQSVPGRFSELAADHVAYQAGELEILRDASAVFRAGEKYIITGESGSGKSTFLRLLAQVGDLGYTGAIRLNGTEIRSADLPAYYQQVCPVFQEPYLFHISLRENILLGRNIPEETYRDVIDKLRLAYLLDRCGGQELTPEMIEQLSGGERQRIALARAMVGEPAVYLLDEVTSALDPENSQRIEGLLLQEDAAVIHICHKPNAAFLPKYHSRFVLADGVLSQEEPQTNK